MNRKAIRNMDSDRSVPPRLFDLVITDDHKVYLEQKIGKNRFERVSWESVKFQVESAIREG